MKKLTAFALGLLLLCLPCQTEAQPFCYEYADPGDYLYCGLRFTPYADYLYWQMCRSDLDFTDSSNNVFFLNPDYQSGWRVGFTAAQGRWDAGARYTSICFTETAFSNETQATFSADWEIADFEAGYAISLECDSILLRPFAGAKLAWLNESFERGTQESNLRKNNFNGCGPYAGIEAGYFLCEFNLCNFCIPAALKGKADIAILNSRSRKDECPRHDCFYAPVFEAQAALEFGGRKCSGVIPYALIGYEVQSWLAKGFAPNQTANLGIGGLVVRLAFEY
jgi:hypothetical protein